MSEAIKIPTPVLCPDCGSEMIDHTESGSIAFGVVSPPDYWMECPVCDATPRCICGGMLAEVRGKPHCTICGGE